MDNRRTWLSALERWVTPETGETPALRLAGVPERSSGAARVVILVATVTVATVAFGQRPTERPTVLVGLVALLGIAWVLRSPAAVKVTLLCALAVAAHLLPGSGPHPFPLGTAVAAWGAVVLYRRDLRETTLWVHIGATDEATRRAGAAVALVAAVVLVLWFASIAPPLEETRQTLAGLPFAVLPAVALFFALVNAGIEELAFRGVLLEGLRSAMGDAAAVLVQASVFGVMHYHAGIPQGPSGALMAGLYGVALGVLRLRARGMIVVWLVHAATDLVIFVLLLAGTR